MDLGLLFTDGDDTIAGFDPNTFIQDGWGVDGDDAVILEFLEPIHEIAFHFPGSIVVQLFNDKVPIYTSDNFNSSVFGGLVSAAPFNTVIVDDPADGFPYIDNLYFGPPIPAPGALLALGLAAMTMTRRRRSLADYRPGRTRYGRIISLSSCSTM